MKEEDAQATLKTIRMRDMLLDARRCRDLHDESLTGREWVLP